MKTIDGLNIEVLIGEMQKAAKEIQESVEVYSDYVTAYVDLRDFTELKIKELTSFVSQHKEAK